MMHHPGHAPLIVIEPGPHSVAIIHLTHLPVSKISVRDGLHPPIIVIVIPACRGQLTTRGVALPHIGAAGIMQVRYAPIRVAIVVRLGPAAAPRDLVAFPDYLASIIVAKVDRGED